MKATTRHFYEDAVYRAVTQIRSTLSEALDLEGLGKLAALAPLHFHRVFRGLTGETPLAMHRRLRLERAAVALATSDTPVTAIAFEAGYETHESFTRAFHEAFALSPTQFRQTTRNPATAWTTATRGTLASKSGIHFTTPPDQLPQLRGNQETKMDVTVEQLPEKRVVALTHRGPYNAISETFARLDAIARAAGLTAMPGLELIAMYHDDPETVPAAALRASAGLVVPRDVACPHELEELRIPTGTYARAVHRGPYTTLGDSWSQLMGSWLVDSGYRVGAGPTYERYVNTPGEVAPKDLVTELYCSLAPGD